MTSVRLRLAAALVSLVLVVALAFGVVAYRGIGERARDRLSEGLEANARLAVELLGPAPFDAARQAEIQRRVGGSAAPPGCGSR